MTDLRNNLNELLANLNVMYTKLHNYHWFVTGEHFFELHKASEELYGEVAAFIDEVAEKMLASNMIPAATMKEYLQLASIEEAKNGLSAGEMVQSITDDISKLILDLKNGIGLADQENHICISNLLQDILCHFEMEHWKLSAYLNS
ncbi:Dps family protein [Chengkuizengella axinellae]|uniref:DNA starvation/stationary phase protection protein n=1 Tax=Chengkuizengella axinellae TaxID=3064388 RepID=A0ABT9J500_9BACL|nr:DNA starvation/stationary phase protection protein [Chengkuizengella sp. 2205SS18-9]MDP5276553.1 DNA starvation/stationary phase protection protein [Chengkuizengella sp. 2205SS18-9]